MSSVSSDRNYTDNTQSGIDATVERVGDLRGNLPANQASKIANLLDQWETEFTMYLKQYRTTSKTELVIIMSMMSSWQLA